MPTAKRAARGRTVSSNLDPLRLPSILQPTPLLPTPYSLPPTPYYLLPTTYYLLSTTFTTGLTGETNGNQPSL
ncbi:MAG: hypothetical protein DPW09_41665 [Anaerolineae bacterium]|nr:hypothetical protein [Anaerolineae bacterium]